MVREIKVHVRLDAITCLRWIVGYYFVWLVGRDIKVGECS